MDFSKYTPSKHLQVEPGVPEPNFYKVLFVWDDEPVCEEKIKECLMCAYYDETYLTPSGPQDEDIFHYDLSFTDALKLKGKDPKETGLDFHIIDVF